MKQSRQQVQRCIWFDRPLEKRFALLRSIVLAASTAVVSALSGGCGSSNALDANGLDSGTTARDWQSLPPGTIVEMSDAGETSQVEGAARALFVRYTITNVKGQTALASGLVLFPNVQPYAEGEWPLVVYGHMTTGAADACAPTHGTPDSTELRTMQQGDEVARQLLSRGVVVARPDYEGIGEEGPHPYLRGDSLAEAMRDMASAVKGRWSGVGNRWVAAGHSEGAVAALNSGNSEHPSARGLQLIGVAAIAPVTQLEKFAMVAEAFPVDAAGVVTGLALKGVAAIDPSFERLLLEEGGLSPRAVELWPDLERLCLVDLGDEASWGGMTVSEIKGPRGDEASAEVRRSLQEDDVRWLSMRREVPIRIDAGIADFVAVLPFTEQLVQDYVGRGYDVTYTRWPEGHSPTADMAAPAIADWILERFAQ